MNDMTTSEIALSTMTAGRILRLRAVLAWLMRLAFSAYRLVFEDHQRHARQQTVLRLRQLEAGNRLDALDAVCGGVDVDEERLRGRLKAVVVRQISPDRAHEVGAVLAVVLQQRSEHLLDESA